MTASNQISAPYQGGCTLISSQIIDLSGNNSFYFTTNLLTGNYNFMTKSGGSNILLLDENGNPWIPTSTWTCVLDFIFYENYKELSHEKAPNLFQQMYKNNLTNN